MKPHKDFLARVIDVLEGLPEREVLTTTNLATIIRTSPGNYIFSVNELMPYRYNSAPHRTFWGSRNTIEAMKRELSA